MFDLASLTWNDQGLIPVIAQDAANGQVLMLAWMNAEALARTLASGQMTYWSRSRQEFWQKGATSGHHQRLIDLRIDCDRDSLLALVEQDGAACHTGRRSCFYTALRKSKEVEVEVEVADPERFERPTP